MKFNMGSSTDFESVQIVHMRQPEQRTYQRRKSSSGGSYISRHSSQRSKRGERSDFSGSILHSIFSIVENFTEIAQYIIVLNFYTQERIARQMKIM